jgi:hypothetical protein
LGFGHPTPLRSHDRRAKQGESPVTVVDEIERGLEAMREDPSKPYSNEDHAAGRDALLAFAPARIASVRCQITRQTGQPPPSAC